MPWGRILLGLIVSALALGTMGSTALMVSGRTIVNLPSAPGLNQVDAVALGAPFEDLISGRDDAMIGRLADADQQQAQAEIDRIQTFVPAGQPNSSRLINYQSYIGTDGQRLNAVHEHVYPAHVARVETALSRATAAQPWRVAGFHVNVATKAELAANRFTLAGKPPTFIAFIAATIINPLFMLATFLAALFRKGLRPRWPWLIATLLGYAGL